MATKVWIVMYTHRFGVDVWPVFEETTVEDQIELVDAWEGDVREDEFMEIVGPFDAPAEGDWGEVFDTLSDALGAAFHPVTTGPTIAGRDDVHVFHRDLLDAEHAAQYQRPWLVQHPDGVIYQYEHEDDACAYQREWRAAALRVEASDE